MAKAPEEWLQKIYSLCVSAGMSEHDAEECVTETVLRYRRRRGMFPWEEDAPNEASLRLMAHDVACEHKRASLRRQRLESEYCAQQKTLHASQQSPEDGAIANADAERFRALLPPYLRDTLTLLEAGYTPAEIARLLKLRPSTVYAYRRDLKAYFVKYFGYDPRNLWGRVGNYSGGCAVQLPKLQMEVNDDATTEGIAFANERVSDCECGSDAAHLSCPCRAQRGGGIKCRQDAEVRPKLSY
ncbi:MAG: sigma-70 family RNA polymerase sigma factor [Fimbriimonadales bacterium]|nr:sigma-70 family RNA polymerase sigma factor [Fimbriimonadales bacterium]